MEKKEQTGNTAKSNIRALTAVETAQGRGSAAFIKGRCDLPGLSSDAAPPEAYNEIRSENFPTSEALPVTTI